MVHEELAARLNDTQYKNWLKAGRCLLILKDGLCPFTEQHMRSFHRDLLNQSSLLRAANHTSLCKPRGNQLSRSCSLCSEWQKVILSHHRQPNTTINWTNCNPHLWRTDHWELAKAYMPRGQAKVKRADECDASALLNLINYCKCFQLKDLKSVRQVIQCRNELMHSCEFRVKEEWMREYRCALQHFLQQFTHIPCMNAVGQKIEDMLKVDLSICVFSDDTVDAAAAAEPDCQVGDETISQWETELLQEMLQECLHAANEEEGADTQDAEWLRHLGGFLRNNKDLGERFSAELLEINKLQSRNQETTT